MVGVHLFQKNSQKIPKSFLKSDLFLNFFNAYYFCSFERKKTAQPRNLCGFKPFLFIIIFKYLVFIFANVHTLTSTRKELIYANYERVKKFLNAEKTLERTC